MVLELWDIRRFKDEKHLASYIGFVPGTHQTGETMWHGRMTRTGNKLVRWVLVQDAWVATSNHEYFGRLYERHKKRKGGVKAIVLVARALLKTIHRVWSEGKTSDHFIREPFPRRSLRPQFPDLNSYSPPPSLYCARISRSRGRRGAFISVRPPMDTMGKDGIADEASLDSFEVALGPKPTVGGLLRAAVAMALTVACAIAFEWKTGDIAWGLWISSLCIGYVSLVVALLLVKIPLRRRDGRGHNVLYYFGMMFIFTLHFGFFHVLYCFELDELLPLDPDPGITPDVPFLMGAALLRYWPLVVTTLLDRIGDFRRIRARIGNHDVVLRPYLNVVRLHLMIAAVAILHEYDAGGAALYVVLAACFFPWGMVIRLIGEPLNRYRVRLLRWGEARQRRENEEFQRRTEELERREAESRDRGKHNEFKRRIGEARDRIKYGEFERREKKKD